jgi:hypothetical protein
VLLPPLKAIDASKRFRFAFCFSTLFRIISHGRMGYMMAKINKLNRFVKKNNDFIRRFTAGVKVVDIDSLEEY